ncbi:MAG: DUF1799 domain-containing protein [Paracoccaceae bacterium]
MQQAWAQAAKAEPEDFGVWPQNFKIVRAFVAITSQWRVVGSMDGLMFLGLDYAGVRAGLKAARIKLSPDEWGQLRLMENAAVAALNARQA